MTLKVDKDTCTSCGSCVHIAPNTFAFGEDGKAYVVNPKGDSEAQIQDAIDSCPMSCISNDEEE